MTKLNLRIGQRIEIPPCHDAWIRGARYGQIIGLRYLRGMRALIVKLDRATRPVVVMEQDWKFIEEI